MNDWIANRLHDAVANNVRPAGIKNQPASRAAFSQNSQEARFSDVLSQASRQLTFSHHAQSRMNTRNIAMTHELQQKLSQATDALSAKRAQNALVVASGANFLINVPNRTVVTVMTKEESAAQIITNIDSAVVL
ncbi:hypothetical protein [Ferroacidibacillus organovorans]|uniref:Flagellar operon protein n=1 Tax=Ferroacidibacillus organovorans TaxID=1765683 RepID=A0A101XPH8_9BACL|nr:hypothetical protein [Ferroacidibacillus organovorans]KUO95064.1 hypothetical protein ATW55_11345 [Ferroacidibacillus organovorans]